MLPDLEKILLGFRTHKYVVVSDISKMFWKIKINPPDADCLRFCWIWEKQANAQIYRALSVTFGVISAPFQAIWTIMHHAKKFQELYPLAARAITEETYMDDINGLKHTKKEAVELARQIAKLLSLASMTPHKWQTNDREILQLAGVPESDWASEKTHKILGVQWDTENDLILFNFYKREEEH